ncbi:MAG: hypothetical protein HRU07_06885 [Nitrosopumilus sp.]|nr:hypothetical protein [Nitrosopumilus sp.]NRA05864.1 hypothetical protein [Nitrosopumilus sp.]
MNNLNSVLVLSLFTVLVMGVMLPSYADYLSPKKQLESGILPEDVICRESRVLVIRDNNNPACVHESTANKMNWNIIATEFVQKEIVSNNAVQIDDKVENMKDTNGLIEQHESITDNKTNNNDEQEQEFIVLDLGSDVEYVDDGREIHVASQRRPAPMNIYEDIVDSQEDNNINSKGLYRVPAGFAHEKYSVNEGIGFYPQDWMPTYVPDGYKLLYITNNHYVDGSGKVSLNIHFVPNTFRLTNQTTDYDIQKSHGFTVYVIKKTTPLDEIEDQIESYKELSEGSFEYVGRFLDVQRDGKIVWASETQDRLNPYQAGYSFHPDEYTSVAVISNYLTLEEIQPIFNNVMN